MVRSTLLLIVLGVVALAVAGCSSADEPDAEPKQEYSPRMREVLATECDERFTASKRRCGVFASCVMRRFPADEFDGVLAYVEGDRRDTKAMDAYADVLAGCGEELGLELDLDTVDSPELITEHEDYLAQRITPVLRDDLCLAQQRGTRAECERFAACVIADLGMVRLIEASRESQETGRLGPELQRVIDSCSPEATARRR